MTEREVFDERNWDPSPGGGWRLIALAAACAVIGLYLIISVSRSVPLPGPDVPNVALPPITAPTTTAPSTATATATATSTAPPPAIAWDRLADCESGTWDAARHPVAGSANWASTRTAIENGRTYHYAGGLHFEADTWLDYRPAGFPSSANLATRAQQIAVAERVLAAQGARAWPTCWAMAFGPRS